MRHRHTRRSGPHLTAVEAIEQLRLKVARNLQVDPDRIKYGHLGHIGKLGTSDPRWLIFYRDEWRELPWHFDGPGGVTRDLVRQWHGDAESP